MPRWILGKGRLKVRAARRVHPIFLSSSRIGAITSLHRPAFRLIVATTIETRLLSNNVYFLTD
jgi:hypothetical protein